MSWIQFLEGYGFKRRPPTLKGIGLEGTKLWYRGDLRLLIVDETYDHRGDILSGPEVLLMESGDPPYFSIQSVLQRMGVKYRRDAHPLELLGQYMDHVLAWFTYRFLLDRGFAMTSNDNRGGGCYTLVFQRGDLALRIDVDGDEERIDFNGMPLADVFRTLGIAGHAFADLRKHIDVILAWLDSTEVVTVSPAGS